MGKYYLGTGTNQYNFQVVDSTGVINDLNLSGLYLSVTGKAADADKLDNYDSSFFRNAANLTGTYTGSISGKAADSELLDGYDSSYFLDGSNITGTVALSGTFTGYYTGVFSGTISHTDYIQFHTGLGLSPDPAELTWNDSQGTIELGLIGGGSTNLGQDLVAYVRNAETGTISKGQVVYLFGAQGDKATVKLASNLSDTTSSRTLGVTIEDITAGQLGYVKSVGVVDGLSLSAYQAGDVLWLGSTPGSLTVTKPQAPNHMVFIGVVERANSGNGQLYVRVQNGYELEELHDVKLVNTQNNDIIRYNGSSGVWYNSNTLALNGTGSHYVSGDLGIGTSSPSARLHIVGADKRQIIASTTDNSALVLGQWDGATNRIESSTRKLLITSYAGGISLGNSGSENVHISTAGSLGVGTTSPGARFEVRKTDGGNAFRFANYVDGVALGSWVGTYGAEFRTVTSGGVSHGMLINNNEANDARHTLDISDSNGLFATFTNGKVGIGTASPAARLHVNKNDSSTTEINPVVIVQNGINSTNTTAGIMFAMSSDSSYQKQGIFTKYTNGSYSIGELHFAVNGAFNSTKVSVADSKMRIAANGDVTISNRVGIGTTSPTEKLYVSGGNAAIEYISGSVIYTPSALNTSPRLTLIGQYSTPGTYNFIRYWSGGSHDWSVGTVTQAVGVNYLADYIFQSYNGSAHGERVRITSDGNVLIGTSSDGGQKLQVAGAAAITGNLTVSGSGPHSFSGRISVTNASGAYAGSFINTDATTAPGLYVQASRTTDSALLVRNASDSSDLLKVTNSGGTVIGGNLTVSGAGNSSVAGNLGIGTTAPGAKLQVNGTVLMDPYSVGRYPQAGTLMVNGGAYSSTSTSGRILISGGAGDNSTHSGYFLRVQNTGGAGAPAPYLAIGAATADAGTSFTDGSEYMRITSTGNVGIGTTAPNKSSFSTAVTVNGATNSGFEVAVGDSRIVGLYASSTAAVLNAFASVPLYFSTNNTTQMVITSGGNVGIGTTSPGAKLDLNGDFKHGLIYRYPHSQIAPALGSTGWIKLATIPNNSRAKFLMKNGSANSEEILEFDVYTTYFNSGVYVVITRNTYNYHLNEIQVQGADGQPRIVYVKCRTSDYAPTFIWQVESWFGAATIHNIEETPTSGKNFAIGTTGYFYSNYASDVRFDGRINFANGIWHKSNDGVERFHYGTSGSTYYKGGGSGAIHTFRNASDVDILTLNNSKDATFSGNITISKTSPELAIRSASDAAAQIQYLTFGSPTYNRAQFRVTSGGTSDGSTEFYTFNAGSPTLSQSWSKEGNVTFAQTVTIGGNLIINGTTTTVNSTVTTIDDPIITLGGDTAPASDDNKDRGVEFKWHNGTAAKTGFFGFDDSTGYFTFIPDATNTSEVFSGTQGDIQASNFRGNLIGNVTGNASTAATWQTARTLTIGSTGKSVNGSADVAWTLGEIGASPTAGSASIITLGTVTTGTWTAGIIASNYGGTGVNNAGRTLTIGTNSGTITFTNATTTLTVANNGSISGTNTGDQTTISGNAGTATTWQTARTLTIGSTGKSVNGSADVTWTTSEIGINNGALTLAVSGTGLSGSASFTANQSGNTTFTVTSNATSANTASTIVARDGSGNFSAGTITASNVSTTTLTQGGTVGHITKEYTFNLSAQSNTQFFPIRLTGTPLGAGGIHTIEVLMDSFGGGDAYNHHSVLGKVRGSGWTDLPAFYDIFHNMYDAAERSYLGFYRGTQNCTDVVLYVRGGKTYYVKTPSTASASTTALTVGDSVFAIKDSTGTDVSGTSANVSLMLNLVTAAQGRHISSNLGVGGNISGTLANTLTLNTNSGAGLSGSATYNNSGAATFTVTSNATNANTASTIVLRDASGNFSAGTINAIAATGYLPVQLALVNNGSATVGSTRFSAQPDGAGGYISFNGTVTANSSGTIISGSSTVTGDHASRKVGLFQYTGGTTGTAGFQFFTADAGTNAILTERLRIQHDGNVGIGTSAPGTKLQVNGGMAFGYGSDATFFTGTEFDSSKYLILQNNTDSYGRVGLAINAKTFSAASTPSANDGWAIDTPRSGIRFRAWLTGDTDYQSKFTIQHLLANAQNANGDLGIFARGFSTTNPAFVLTGAGNVGIGTTSPGQKLEVNGNILATGHITSSTSTNIDQFIRVTNSNAANSAYSRLAVSNGSYEGSIVVYGTGFTNNNAAMQNRMTIAAPFICNNVSGQHYWWIGTTGAGNDPTNATQVMTLTLGGQFITQPYNYSYSAWGVDGINTAFRGRTVTNNSTTASGTVVSAAIHSFAQSTLAATNTGVTTTDAATVYIAGGVIAGTNQTITNSYGLWNAGKTRLDGNVGIGTTSPSAKLDISGNSVQDVGLVRFVNDSTFGTFVPTASFIQTRGNHSYGTVAEFRVNTAGDTDRPTILFRSAQAAHQWRVGQVTSGWGTNDNFGIGYAASNASPVAWPTNYFTITTGGNVGIGVTGPSYKLEVNGSFAATTKSFVIKHPTKEGKKLRYGSLEGPENGVYVRGKTTSKVIELPDYWTKLVDPDSISVQLTPIGSHQKLYVEKIEDNKVYIANENLLAKSINCFFYILAERADVEKLQVEIDA